MTKKMFTEEYKHLRATLRDKTFAEDSKVMCGKLKTLCAVDGPEVGSAGVLKDLQKGRKNKVAQKLLGIAGGDPGQDDKAAALKMLTHLHLLKRQGGHSLWVVSLPDVLKKWPSDAMSGKNGASLEAILNDMTSRFSKKQMKDLSHSTQEAGAWANKAMKLAAESTGKEKEKRNRLIKRWFADENTKEEAFDDIALKLKEGFKKIAVAALSPKMIVTDNPFHRGTGYENANAYVWGDTLNVVYVESGFFGPGGDPLSGLTNWTRIMVHELSHSQLKTEDHRYRHHDKGLAPKAADFDAGKAITNADSWAFFCADANGKLTKRDLKYVLE